LQFGVGQAVRLQGFLASSTRIAWSIQLRGPPAKSMPRFMTLWHLNDRQIPSTTMMPENMKDQRRFLKSIFFPRINSALRTV
jgi:hypothetical protein